MHLGAYWDYAFIFTVESSSDSSYKVYFNVTGAGMWFNGMGGYFYKRGNKLDFNLNYNLLQIINTFLILLYSN